MKKKYYMLCAGEDIDDPLSQYVYYGTMRGAKIHIRRAYKKKPGMKIWIQMDDKNIASCIGAKGWSVYPSQRRQIKSWS